jgi:hypothetical protein
MKFQLNSTEMADWQELWCFRCEHDHGFSHLAEEGLEERDGCPLLTAMVLGDDVPDFEPRDSQWPLYVPAQVSCRRFTECTACLPDPPDAERRGGETRREFHDRLRRDMQALPVVDAVVR